MSRHAARVDRNHGEVREALRKAGFVVVDTYNVGGGFPDLCVGIVREQDTVTVLLEVKDGQKPESARQLKPDQRKFFRTFPGPKAIVYTPEEAVSLCGRIQNGDTRATLGEPFATRLPR